MVYGEEFVMMRCNSTNWQNQWIQLALVCKTWIKIYTLISHMGLTLKILDHERTFLLCLIKNIGLHKAEEYLSEEYIGLTLCTPQVLLSSIASIFML